MRILQHNETQLTLQYRPFSALAYSLFFAGLAVVMPFQVGPNPDLGGTFCASWSCSGRLAAVSFLQIG